MTDFSMKYDTDFNLDTKAQTLDLTAFHRHDSYTLTPTDKEENKIYQRLTFFKISCNSTLHTFAFAPPHNAYASQKQKSAILPTHNII